MGAFSGHCETSCRFVDSSNLEPEVVEVEVEVGPGGVGDGGPVGEGEEPQQQQFLGHGAVVGLGPDLARVRGPSEGPQYPPAFIPSTHPASTPGHFVCGAGAEDAGGCFLVARLQCPVHSSAVSCTQCTQHYYWSEPARCQ